MHQMWTILQHDGPDCLGLRLCAYNVPDLAHLLCFLQGRQRLVDHDGEARRELHSATAERSRTCSRHGGRAHGSPPPHLGAATETYGKTPHTHTNTHTNTHPHTHTHPQHTHPHTHPHTHTTHTKTTHTNTHPQHPPTHTPTSTHPHTSTHKHTSPQRGAARGRRCRTSGSCICTVSM